tara:strand:- start:9882 stop:11012 length:1131 start_codon:yes stop_codon:yes gene_type:complete
MKNSLILNFANIHSGGALQVACAFINDMQHMKDDMKILRQKYNVICLMSTELDSFFQINNNEIASLFDKVEIKNFYGFGAMKYTSYINSFKPKIIFSLFGPTYFFSNATEITGFAQPWIINEDKNVYKQMPYLSKIFNKIKFEIQWRFFLKANVLIAELPSVKNRLAHYRKFKKDIMVARNSLNPILIENEESTNLWIQPKTVKFGYPTRNYIHKNINFAIELIDMLNKDSAINYELHLTLCKTEYKGLNIKNKSFIKNHGRLNLKDLKEFYKTIDCVIFPSLLECFSATPIESLFFKKILFCSNRDFIKDSIGENAVFFDPYDLDSTKKVIKSFFNNKNSNDINKILETGYQYVLKLPTSAERSSEYLKILKKYG